MLLARATPVLSGASKSRKGLYLPYHDPLPFCAALLLRSLRGFAPVELETLYGSRKLRGGPQVEPVCDKGRLSAFLREIAVELVAPCR